MNVVLVGFMGSGKSKVGRLLAERTGRTHLDTDDLIAAEGETISELFRTAGETEARKRERAVVREASKATDAIISTGGGAVLDERNVRDLKKDGVIVYLKADRDELVRRLSNSRKDRPLLKGHDVKARVDELMDERSEIYERVADFVVRTDSRSPGHVVDAIVKRFSLNGTSRTARVRVGTQPPYSVEIGRGLLSGIRTPKGAERAVVVSHPKLRRLYGDRLQLDVEHTWATFPEGEDNKTLDTARQLSEALAKAGLHRGDVVVALGGGVVGDVAGFVASTFGRGIAVIQAPTTLLAMVDSSIGGKTGVNLPQGKNLVGTFHQPFAVVADLDVLETLPERDLRGGLAEVIKYGFLSDRPLVDLVLDKRDQIFGRGDVLQSIIRRCAKIKADVVASDEKDHGLRAILNYGHTLGHAIELVSDLHHGEAISVGMVYAATVAKLLGMSDLVSHHREVLEAVGLPTSVERMSWRKVRERMVLDKKYSGGDRLVLLAELGKPVVRDVPVDVLEEAWRAI